MRVLQGWVVATLLLMVTVATVHAQTAPGSGEVLAAASLTAADLPMGLQTDPQRTGPGASEESWPTYTATFRLDPAMTTTPAAGTIVGVVNTMAQAPDAPGALERFLDGLRRDMPGDSTDAPAPAVGEGSRALANRAPGPPGLTAMTAVVGFRRANVAVVLLVTRVGEEAPLDLATQLAGVVDQRLAAALP